MLRNQPGNIHAAIWSATLIVSWVIPFSPLLIPRSIVLPFYSPTIVQFKSNESSPIPLTKIIPSNSAEKNRLDFHPSTRSSGSPVDVRAKGDSTSLRERKGFNTFFHKEGLQERVTMILVVVWGVGVCISFFRWIRSTWKVNRLISTSQVIRDPDILAEIERTRQLLFINGTIRQYTANIQTAPFVMGLFRPLIFFPQYMLQKWTSRNRLAVIAHELAHVKRYDLAAHHVMCLLRILLWFLPPIWWMQRELHRTQDAACDECAAVVLGNSQEFGKVLLQLAESCLISDFTFPALGLLHSKPSLISRLENIMNAHIYQLSRLSFTTKLILFVVSCIAFLSAGTFQQLAYSQSLSIELLGNYSGERNAMTIHSVVYAPPYYVVVGVQNEQRIVQYYEYAEGTPTLRYTLRPDPLIGNGADANLESLCANEKFVVLFYEKSDISHYLLFDHSSTPVLVQQVYLTHIDGDVVSSQLEGNDLYFSTGGNGNSLYRRSFNSEGSLVKQWNFVFPEHTNVIDFALFNEEILLSDGFGEDEGNVDPGSGMRTGVARSWINESGNLEIDSTRWFTTDFQPFVYRILTQDSTIFVNQNDMRTFTDEVWIVDGSDKTSPQVIQTITTGKVNKYWNGRRMDVYGTLLAVPIYSETLPTKTGIDLYQKGDHEYQRVAQFPQAQGRIALGPEYLVETNANALTFYDITRLTEPKEIATGIESAFQCLQLTSSNFYLYIINKAGTQKQLLTLDTAAPVSTQIVAQQTFPDDLDMSIQTHDGLFSCLIPKTSLSISKMNEDGSMGSEISLDSHIPEERRTYFGNVLYNDSFWIPIFYIPQPDGKTTPDPTYPELSIYSRTGNQIDEQVSSTLSLTVNTQKLALYEDKLFEFRTEITSETGDEISQIDNITFLYTYTLDDPTRPTLLSKFRIPSSDESTRGSGMSISDVAVHGNYLVYGSSLSESGVIDISDPENPKHVSFLPKARYVFWYNNLLGMGFNNPILFYEIDPLHGPIEIAQIENAKSLNVSISGNRMYVRRTDGGIDIYELELETTGGSTGIFHWTLY